MWDEMGKHIKKIEVVEQLRSALSPLGLCGSEFYNFFCVTQKWPEMDRKCIKSEKFI